MDIKKKNFIEVVLDRKTGIVNFNANIENRFQAKYMLSQAKEDGHNFAFAESEELKVSIATTNGKATVTEAFGHSRDEIRFLLDEAYHIQRRIDIVNTYKLHYKMNYLMLCSIIDTNRAIWFIKRLFYIGHKYKPTNNIKKVADEILSRVFKGEY